jgi:AraC-like DNA-binding protein
MLQVVRKNSGTPATAVAVRSWMDSYRAAWEDLDRTELTRLFSLQTHVSGHPFDRPVGYAQLPSLWDDLAARQCENFLEFDIVKVFGRRAYVLWRCLTTNPASRIRRQGYGVFALAFDGTACTEQMEWSKWPKNAGDAPPIPVSKIRSLTRHIDQRPGDRITISRLAEMYRLSSRHATRLFRIFAGLPIHQYVVRQRLIRARERLAWGDERIVDIAYDLGFANQAHFISAFKQSTAFTPAQYRSRFSQLERGPVHHWLEVFRQSIADGQHLRLINELSVPGELQAGLRQRAIGLWIDGLALEVLADTPSTALVHWQLPRLPEGSAGDGILILKFAPDGRCHGKENYFHWQ